MITEKEAVLRERAAYLAGADDRARHGPGAKQWVTSSRDGYTRSAADESTQRYPLRKIIRPRVLTAERLPHHGRMEYAFIGGKLQWRPDAGSFWQDIDFYVTDTTREFLGALGDLANNPTEEVEDTE